MCLTHSPGAFISLAKAWAARRKKECIPPTMVKAKVNSASLSFDLKMAHGLIVYLNPLEGKIIVKFQYYILCLI